MNVPEGIGVEYEGNVAFNAGEYNAHAILRFDEDNLEVASPADCQWRINKRRIDISGAYWDYAGVYTYDGQEHGVYLAGLPDGLNIDYTDNVKIETGSYVASASLSPVDPFNFEVPEVNGCSWAIRKADRALGKVEWTDCGSFVYDGKLKRVEIESGLDDDIMVEYESESAVNAGKYLRRLTSRLLTAPITIRLSLWDIRGASPRRTTTCRMWYGITRRISLMTEASRG